MAKKPPKPTSDPADDAPLMFSFAEPASGPENDRPAETASPKTAGEKTAGEKPAGGNAGQETAKKAARKASTKKAAKKASKKKASGSASTRAAGGGPGSEAGVDEKPPEMPPPPAPVPLSSIVGQERAIEVLRSSLRSGRPHHGWIFHGPPGVGKFTAAVAFAAVLLDPTSSPDGAGDVAPDPRSTVQRALREGAHPDLHIVRKELALYSSDPRVRASKQMTIAKDVVRQHLIEPSTRSALLAPGGLARKVFVVDEAELLDPSPTNAPSQNALLKTLEEPPEGTVIILVTSNADRLLPTVRSRCQRVAFGTLGEDGLRRVADRLGVPTSGAVWDRLTLLAGGSPGRLVDAYRTGVEEWWAELEPRLDRVASGRADATLGQRMAELVEAWAKRQVELAPHASKDSMNRRGASRMFHLVAEHARRRLGSEGPIGPPLRQIDAVGEAERRLATNAQVSMVFEALSAELVAAGGG